MRTLEDSWIEQMLLTTSQRGATVPAIAIHDCRCLMNTIGSLVIISIVYVLLYVLSNHKSWVSKH